MQIARSMSESTGECLRAWQLVHDAGRTPATVLYHRELVTIFEREFPSLAVPPGEVTAAHVAEFLQRVAHYSAPRFNALVNILRRIIPAAQGVRRRPVHPKAVTLPGQAEFAALLAELDARPRSHAGLIVRLLALTGMRIGEARRLRWDAIAPAGILVPSGKGRPPRLVPYVEGVREVLERLRGVTGGGALVLPSASVKRALRASCARAGIRRLGHHDLRRLFATRAIECGVDVPTASRWLGHCDGGALLARTYFQLADEHGLRMAARVRITAALR